MPAPSIVPIPYNRMYNPDIIEDPIKGDINIDHMDEQLPWMNYLIWAEDINSHGQIASTGIYPIEAHV